MSLKLWDLPMRKGVKLLIQTERAPLGKLFTFSHLDGMYSYNTADSDGSILHLRGSTPLVKKERYYEIAEEE